jgi:GWxTD domain-containing protein
MASTMRYIFILSFLFTTPSFTQPNEDMPRSRQMQFEPISFEAVPFWSEDTTVVEVAIFYRIHPEFFFFAKTTNAQHEIYEANGELVFEVFDKKDIACTREVRPLHIVRNSPPEEGIPFSEEVQGALIFKLKRGFYKIVLEAKDSESGKSFINRDMIIDARSPSSGIIISPALCIDPVFSDTLFHAQKYFFPINRGGSIIIGQTGGFLFQVLSPDTITAIHLLWTVNNKLEGDEDNLQELQGERYYQEYGTPAVIVNQKRPSISIQGNSKHSRMVYIPLPIEKLETGRYQLTLTATQGTLKSNMDFSFNIIWPLKPHSLSDFKLSVDALRHIATEAELDSMTAFSSSASRKAFRAFWRRHNPDTTRAFNTAMAEYYRRVDEAIKRFSSANETDGYRTDRGRIYILFGSPSFVNRLLKPNSAPSEIWTYEKLKRRFFFTDQRKTGNYILVKMENY